MKLETLRVRHKEKPGKPMIVNKSDFEAGAFPDHEIHVEGAPKSAPKSTTGDEGGTGGASNVDPFAPGGAAGATGTSADAPKAKPKATAKPKASAGK